MKLNDVDNFMLGNKQVDKIYLGNTEIWTLSNLPIPTKVTNVQCGAYDDVSHKITVAWDPNPAEEEIIEYYINLNWKNGGSLNGPATYTRSTVQQQDITIPYNNSDVTEVYVDIEANNAKGTGESSSVCTHYVVNDNHHTGVASQVRVCASSGYVYFVIINTGGIPDSTDNWRATIWPNCASSPISDQSLIAVSGASYNFKVYYPYGRPNVGDNICIQLKGTLVPGDFGANSSPQTIAVGSAYCG